MALLRSRLLSPVSRYSGERGSTTLELTIWTLPLLVVIGLLIVGGRMALAGNAVQSAAYAGAREATLARSLAQAEGNGRSAAALALDLNGVNCVTQDIVIDASDFNKPIGDTGEVRTTLTCTVNLSDAGIPGLPGSVAITRAASSPVDPYRQR
jgi:Flp pilus assembly protein TadG